LQEIAQGRDDPTLDWLNTILLQRVCQVLSQCEHEGAKVGRTRMLEHIKAAYEAVKLPPAAKALLQGQFLGVFYTWFDGLYHREVLGGSTELSGALCSLDASFKSSLPSTTRNQLVLLRGSIDMAQTLVVTERQHEDLSLFLRAGAARLAGAAAAAVDGKSHSVLILGACPRDPVLRQACQGTFEYLERLQEGRYFAYPRVPSADTAFWTGHDVNWLAGEFKAILDAVCEAIA